MESSPYQHEHLLISQVTMMRPSLALLLVTAVWVSGGWGMDVEVLALTEDYEEEDGINMTL